MRRSSNSSETTWTGWNKPRRGLGVLVDRCVPPTVVDAINRVDDFHAVALDVMYAPRGPKVPDVEFLVEAGERGWIILTANPRMWFVPSERDAIVNHGARVFCYGSAQLPIQAQGLVFGRWLLSIRRRSRRPGPCFWADLPHADHQGLKVAGGSGAAQSVQPALPPSCCRPIGGCAGWR